jgi:uncharacterized Zn-binding protein involved in type VI secretion
MPAAARLGDKAQVDADAHGCPACPHPAIGPVVTGSPDVFVNGKPAARQGDLGIHAVCCGPNTFTIQRGSPTVYVNGKPFARMNDQTKHCGSSGPIIDGSPDVNIDDGAGAQGLGSYAMRALQILLQQAAAQKQVKKQKHSDTHTASAAPPPQNLASTPSQGHVKTARWSMQRARKDEEVPLLIECTADLKGLLSIDVWLLDADGTPSQRMHSVQANAAETVKAKWKVQIPPRASGRNEVEFQFVVKDAHGVEVTSDTLFVQQPWFRAQLVDADGSALAGWNYELTLPDGTVVKGQTDSEGRIRAEPGAGQGACKLVIKGP